MRLITEPFDRVLQQLKEEAIPDYNAGHAAVYLSKAAANAATVHALSGELVVSDRGWLLLKVPNALIRGAFDALNEQGVELPTNAEGRLNGHISVMRPEEIDGIGGVDKITERGHHFGYTLGPVQEVEPEGWDDVSKVWFIKVKSIELQNLRKSYGLSPLPNDNKFDFHITIAKKRKKVLQHNDVSKAAGIITPLVRTGGLALDVAGLKSIAGHNKKDEEDSEAESVENDDSVIEKVRSLPTKVPKLTTKKRLRPQAIKLAIEYTGENNALRMSEEGFSCKEADYNGIVKYYSTPGSTTGCARSTTSSEDRKTPIAS